MKVFILSVSHNDLRSIDFKAAGDTVVFDTKGFLDRSLVDGRL